ncbi:MAG: hypothetical protein WBF39_04505 [Planococcus donghaensis]
MSKFPTESKLHSEKTRTKGVAPAYHIVKSGGYATTENPSDSESSQSLPPQKSGEVGSPRINTGKKVIVGKVRNTRTGPQGKKAMISDGAVESISERTEKRTRKAIAKIGKSIGF